MNVEEKVQAVLAANAGVIAIVDAESIRVPGNWQDLNAPYIIHKPITVTPNRTSGGLATLKMWRYQVDCFGGDYKQAKELAVAVRSALEYRGAGNFQGLWIGEGPHFYQQNLNVHQIPVEFELADSL